MQDEVTKTCMACQGAMSPVLVMDRDSYGITRQGPHPLHYRQPDDKQSFWTGQFPTAGIVQAYMCAGCGKIDLYGSGPTATEEEVRSNVLNP